MLIHARHAVSQKPMTVEVHDGRIVRMEPARQVSDLWIAPSFFDVQVNGCFGVSFNSPDLSPAEIRRVVDELKRHGCGGFFPTLITASADALTHGFRTLARACEQDAELDAMMPGFHLEGPYIAPDDGPRGAHPKSHVRPPNREEFQHWQEAAGGRIRLVTLAPEIPGGIEFIEWLTGQGIIASIGHTAAKPSVIRAAIAAGARLGTHLGNGCAGMIPRHENHIWEQLANDSLSISLIADGHHLPAAVLSCFLRMKSPSRVILVSDAGSLAGLPPGRYDCWGQQFEVHPAGKIVLPGTEFLAGSAIFLDDCVKTLLRLGLASVQEIVQMASVGPRELFGLPVPRLAVGEPADFVVLNAAGEMVRAANNS